MAVCESDEITVKSLTQADRTGALCSGVGVLVDFYRGVLWRANSYLPEKLILLQHALKHQQEACSVQTFV